MIASFIVRLIDPSGELLAWAEVQAQSRPQGRPKACPFVAQGPTLFTIERDGEATGLSIHWHELDVARYTPLMTPGPVQVGQVQRFDWIEPVWLVSGASQVVSLPPVTVRTPVRIGVPVGGLGVVS